MGLFDYLTEYEAEGDYELKESVYTRINGELQLVMEDGKEVPHAEERE